jgi:hypothetical protein
MAAKKKPAGSSADAKDSKDAKETKSAGAAPAAAEKKAAAPKKPAAAAGGSKKTPAKKEARGGSTGTPSVPLVDTNAAAQVAATLIAKKVAPLGEGQQGGTKKSSAAFEQLKQSVNKPHSSVMSNILGVPQGKKSGGGHTEFNKQVGHNQTYGADVNRTGVPRRTPG